MVFTHGRRRSTIDRIITLNLILQSRREYQRPLWIAYVDLKADFYSVDLMTIMAITPQLRLA